MPIGNSLRAEGSLASLGKEMPSIARRDMFARGKRDIQKCDMFARLTRYALRARKASSDTVARLGERNAAPYINKNIKKFLKEGTGEKFFSKGFLPIIPTYNNLYTGERHGTDKRTH